MMRLGGPQPQHDILHLPLLGGDVLAFRQVQPAGYVPVQVPGVPIPHASEVGVSPGAEARVLLQHPVFQIVPGLIARLGEVGNLVLLIAVLGQQLHGVEVHIRLQVPVRQVQALPPVIQRRPLLQLQPVAGDVPGSQHQGVGQGVFPLLHSLVRQTVDQVQADVVQPRLAAGGHGVLHLLPGVDPAQPPQGLVVRGLHPQGDAVEARPAQGPQSPPVPGAVGVGLQGDLRPVPDPALLLHGFQQGNKPLVAQIAGGAAAEIDGVHPVVLHLGGHLGDVPGQGRGIGVHLFLAMGQGVKIAIGALGLAEGNVQIQAQGAIAVDHRLFHISSPWAAGWSPRQTDS